MHFPQSLPYWKVEFVQKAQESESNCWKKGEITQLKSLKSFINLKNKQKKLDIIEEN